MSPEKQRIAIAKAIGWEQSQTSAKACWDQHGASCYWSDAPDYLNDLNAMHEAEKVLNDDQQLHYITFLMGRKNTDGMWDLSWDAAYHCAHAHAAQRAEAFLRTIGKWEAQTEHRGATEPLAGGEA